MIVYENIMIMIPILRVMGPVRNVGRLEVVMIFTIAI